MTNNNHNMNDEKLTATHISADDENTAELEVVQDEIDHIEETTEPAENVEEVVEKDESDQTGEMIFSDSEETPRKKRHLTINIFILLLLVVAIVLLVLSMYAYKNRDRISQDTPKTVEPASISATTPVPTALPEELISTNSLTILVDKTHSLPSDYVPANLATPYLNSTTDVIQVVEEAGNQAKQMIQAASDAGITLVVTAGYRSYEEQEVIYKDRVDLLGEEQANRQVQKPGYSEHQTGLALDLTDDASKVYATSEFGDTDAGKWLYEHAHEYGFIQRYPQGKEAITGYDYNPSHYRYVGVDVANAIYAVSPDETFEEYFQISN